MKFSTRFFGQSSKEILKTFIAAAKSSAAILLAIHWNIRGLTLLHNDCTANLMVERPNKIDN